MKELLGKHNRILDNNKNNHGMKRICDFIAKWMGVMVLLVAAVSFVVPKSLTWVGTWVINPMLGIVVGMQNFGLATSLAVLHKRIEAK